MGELKWPELWRGIMLGIAGWMLNGEAQALCVLMQDFADAPEFEMYEKQDLYYPHLTWSYQTEDGHGIPTPAKVSMAGDPCYIFSSYQDLAYYLENNKAMAGRKYQLPQAGEDQIFTTPEVAEDEPIIIHQISHGDRNGIVYRDDAATEQVVAEDILAFVKKWGAQHPIAMTNDACYASDLLARTLLDQNAHPDQDYIDKFCLMTASPFSHSQVEMFNDEVDSSTAPFISKMREVAPGTSFADYYRENNYYVDYKGHKRPLGIISGANWQEMGLVDYLVYGEDIFYFTNLYFDHLDGSGDLPHHKFTYPDHLTAEDFANARLQLAANLINHLNEMLNVAYCKNSGDPQNFRPHEFLYFAANTVCQNLTEIRDAQYCIPRYHVAHTDYLLDDGNYNQKADWDKDCRHHEKLTQALQNWRQAGPAMREQRAEEFVAVAAQLQKECAELACRDMDDNDKAICILVAADKATRHEDFRQQKAELLQKVRQLQKEYEYAPMLSKLITQELHLNWPPQEIEAKLDAYYAAHDMDPVAQKLDCTKKYAPYFDLYPSPQDQQELVHQCSVLYQDLGKTPLAQWPKLPTNYPAGSKYADYLAQILLGAIDINQQTGLGLNGIPASSGDVDSEKMPEMDGYLSPSRDILLQFHNVMGVAMQRQPKKEFPLDVKRRQACENFKLGGIAAQ